VRRFSPFVFFALSIAISSCGAGSYDLELQFADGVDGVSVRYIELLVLPSCPETGIVSSGDYPSEQAVARLGLAQTEAATLPMLSAIPPGRYGFYARGFDESCFAVASGCSTVRIEKHGSGVVRVVLDATTTPNLACTSGICTDGRCDAADGGSGSDACVANPCGADRYCVDLADPAPNDASGRQCLTNSVCTTGQYQYAAPSTRTDRICMDCAACTSLEYQTTACADGNGPANRGCTSLTDCGVGQYQTVAPTATTDRSCGDCTVCASDQYTAIECSNGNGTQDRICGGGSATCTLVATADGSTVGNNSATPMSTTSDGVTSVLAYVKFDLAANCAEGAPIPANATVTAITISLTETSACVCAGTGHELRRITGAWTEASTLTSANPTVATSVSAAFSTPGVNSTVAISDAALVADVQTHLDDASTNHGFRVGQSTTAGNLASPWQWATREHPTAAFRPTIVVTYTRP